MKCILVHYIEAEFTTTGIGKPKNNLHQADEAKQRNDIQHNYSNIIKTEPIKLKLILAEVRARVAGHIWI